LLLLVCYFKLTYYQLVNTYLRFDFLQFFSSNL
jgi:hypothetical protein